MVVYKNRMNELIMRLGHKYTVQGVEKVDLYLGLTDYWSYYHIFPGVYKRIEYWEQGWN